MLMEPLFVASIMGKSWGGGGVVSVEVVLSAVLAERRLRRKPAPLTKKPKPKKIMAMMRARVRMKKMMACRV